MVERSRDPERSGSVRRTTAEDVARRRRPRRAADAGRHADHARPAPRERLERRDAAVLRRPPWGSQRTGLGPPGTAGAGVFVPSGVVSRNTCPPRTSWAARFAI